MKKIYLVDFDGTITKKDTLDHLAKYLFPDLYKIWGEKIMNEKMTVSEWINEFENNYNFSKERYDEVLLLNTEIDESFTEFIKTNNVVIVSGGFLYNIEKILEIHGIEELKIFGNKLVFSGEKKINIDMLYSNSKCKKCGVCKKNIVLNYRKEYDFLVYVGDGITDYCPSEYCDRIYAKENSSFEKYLNKKSLEYYSFDSFNEIIDNENNIGQINKI